MSPCCLAAADFCCWSRSCLAFLLSFKTWLANFIFLISLISIASSKFIESLWRAIWILASNILFSSSSGTISIKIPKSLKYNSLISSIRPTLNLPIWFTNSSLNSEYWSISAILLDNAVHNLCDICKLASNICLVAVLLLKAANFCNPTNA